VCRVVADDPGAVRDVPGRHQLVGLGERAHVVGGAGEGLGVDVGEEDLAAAQIHGPT